MNRPIFSIVLAALVVAAGCSSRSAAPDIRLGDGWARATAPGQTNGAAYLVIDNPSDTADRLVSVATTRTATATLHRSAAAGGVMQMRILGALLIPAGQRIALAPGGTHIMLSPLATPLKAGERFALSLRFERAGDRRVLVSVVAPGAR